MRELPIPPDARSTQDAIELIRCWVIDGYSQCSLLPTMWAEQPETWGILLADVAHHISEAAATEGRYTQRQILQSIADRFAAEVAAPTAEHEGSFVERADSDDRGS